MCPIATRQRQPTATRQRQATATKHSNVIENETNGINNSPILNPIAKKIATTIPTVQTVQVVLLLIATTTQIAIRKIIAIQTTI